MSVFMLTLKGSSKQINITSNPQVSILIDTRIDSQQSGLPIKALTVYGKAEFVNNSQRHLALVDEMADKFPTLAELAGDNRCLVIQMRIEKMLLLDGIIDQSTFYILSVVFVIPTQLKVVLDKLSRPLSDHCAQNNWRN